MDKQVETEIQRERRTNPQEERKSERAAEEGQTGVRDKSTLSPAAAVGDTRSSR